MWDIIANKVHGSELKTSALINKNPQYAEVIIFSAGVELEVPEILEVTEFADLPPWKRVS